MNRLDAALAKAVSEPAFPTNPIEWANARRRFLTSDPTYLWLERGLDAVLDELVIEFQPDIDYLIKLIIGEAEHEA